MNDMEKIMTIGVLKGIHSQSNDTDVRYALERCIDILGKLLSGYELVEPKVAAAPEASVEAVQTEDDPMDYTE